MTRAYSTLKASSKTSTAIGPLPDEAIEHFRSVGMPVAVRVRREEADRREYQLDNPQGVHNLRPGNVPL